MKKGLSFSFKWPFEDNFEVAVDESMATSSDMKENEASETPAPAAEPTPKPTPKPDFDVSVLFNGWTKVTSQYGRDCYGPYVTVRVTNNKAESVSSLKVEAVFYREDTKECYGSASSYLVSSLTDAPLRSGYSKEATLKVTRNLIMLFSGDFPDMTA